MKKVPSFNYSFLAILTTSIGFYSCEAPPKETTKPWPVQITQTSESTEPVIKEKPAVAEKTDETEVDHLRQRLVEAYTTYWPLISSEHQHAQLPEVLGDSMDALRVFGVERVGVFLRDGEATEEELQLVVDRLNDKSPKVRLAVAKLLAEIHVPGLQEHVAKSLTLETDNKVVQEELVYFQTNPHIDAIRPTAIRLLQNPNGNAGETLVALLKNITVDQSTAREILDATKHARRVSDSPSLITIEAMLGNRSTQKRLVYLLNSNNELIRTAVAEGFASSGFAEPLIQRANDPSMYMYALSALQKKSGLDSFQQLLELRVPDDSSWNTTAIEIATSLSTTDLGRVDDILKRKEELDDLRLAILSTAWRNSLDKSIGDKKAIAKRIVPLMIEFNDAVGALQLLNEFDDSVQDDDIIALRFTSAINALSWSDAADARPEPAIWISAWQEMIDQNPATAEAIKKQIIQRYSEQLNPEQMELLGITIDNTLTEEPKQ